MVTLEGQQRIRLQVIGQSPAPLHAPSAGRDKYTQWDTVQTLQRRKRVTGDTTTSLGDGTRSDRSQAQEDERCLIPRTWGARSRQARDQRAERGPPGRGNGVLELPAPTASVTPFLELGRPCNLARTAHHADPVYFQLRYEARMHSSYHKGIWQGYALLFSLRAIGNVFLSV